MDKGNKGWPIFRGGWEGIEGWPNDYIGEDISPIKDD